MPARFRFYNPGDFAQRHIPLEGYAAAVLIFRRHIQKTVAKPFHFGSGMTEAGINLDYFPLSNMS
jgi:hypothetical protein